MDHDGPAQQALERSVGHQMYAGGVLVVRQDVAQVALVSHEAGEAAVVDQVRIVVTSSSLAAV